MIQNLPTMFQSIFLSSLLFTVTSIGILGSANIVKAETDTPSNNPPAETYQPGFWQPVARVDVSKPINIKIINETGILLDYAFTDASVEPLLLEEGATRTIENIQPPAYIVIYPDIKAPNSSRISLKYFVNVTQDNTIELTVKQIENISDGNRTFNLQRTGAIYLF